MPRRAAVSVENNFRGGLITETTSLNFPENACTETYDCIHDVKGRIYRRPGMEYEVGYDTNAVEVDQDVVSGFTWNNVKGDGTVSLRVQQVGSKLYFYNITSGAALSDSLIADTVNLTTYATSTGVDVSLNECEYTAGNGFLIVTHPNVEPLYITYDATTEAVTETQITMYIRDLEGVDDALAVNNRPTASVGTMTDTHKYNLYNQGWYYNSAAALATWDAARTDLPSNADIWWLFKDSTGAFATSQIANVDPGTSNAPRGHYTLNLFNQDRNTASGLSGITAVTTGNARFSTCASMAGRIFYGGLNYSGYNSRIYFSQIIVDQGDVGLLYQVNDPTSEDLSDLLPSDGGWLNIVGMEACIKLVPLVNVLLVFATNGIWAITGSQGIGFTANDYTVTKISSVGAVHKASFVDVDGFPYWWNLDGIYKIVPSGSNDLSSQNQTTPQTGGFDVISLTNTTIRTFYHAIPTASRRLARGAYNPLEKIVQWVYRNDDSADTDTDYTYDRVLNYNILTGSFYPWRMPADHAVRVHDVLLIKGEGGTASTESVVELDGGTWTALQNIEIQDQTGDVITSNVISRSLIEPTFKFFVSATSGDNRALTFAEARNIASYKDWILYDSTGTTFTSTFTTGYKIHGDTQRFFQSNYVFVFLEQEDSASCTMRGLWEWTSSNSSHRWSASQQIYNSNLVYRNINFRRLKVRGKGRALQLQFTSDDNKPFTIVGWSIFETQNAGL